MAFWPLTRLHAHVYWLYVLYQHNCLIFEFRNDCIQTIFIVFVSVCAVTEMYRSADDLRLVQNHCIQQALSRYI